MSTGWAFYNAVRAWVAQHPIPPPAKAVEGAADTTSTPCSGEPLPFADDATAPSTPPH